MNVGQRYNLQNKKVDNLNPLSTFFGFGIVSEPINSYGINLAKPTVVVTAIGCMVTYLKFFDYTIVIAP